MNCIFCDIAEGRLPAPKQYEDEDIMAFRDIAPKAPTHMLIVPKSHIATLNDANQEHLGLLGKMLLTASQLAAQEGLAKPGYRLVMNINNDGGQTVHHIHLHLLGGRQLSWPPG